MSSFVTRHNRFVEALVLGNLPAKDSQASHRPCSGMVSRNFYPMYLSCVAWISCILRARELRSGHVFDLSPIPGGRDDERSTVSLLERLTAIQYHLPYLPPVGASNQPRLAELWPYTETLKLVSAARVRPKCATPRLPKKRLQIDTLPYLCPSPNVCRYDSFPNEGLDDLCPAAASPHFQRRTRTNAVSTSNMSCRLHICTNMASRT